MSLVAHQLERSGIPTTTQLYLRQAAEKLRPPRALLVPFDHGYALGDPHDVRLQYVVLRETLALLDDTGPAPVLKEFEPERELTAMYSARGAAPVR